MRNIVKSFIICFALIAMLANSMAFAAPSDYSSATPSNLNAGMLYGASTILINADTHEVLFSKEPDTRRYPASTTKIMTCLLGLESDLMGQVVTIPSGIEVSSDSSKMGLTVGDRMLFDDLLYGMMLASGNDAALAVAILVSGTSNEFVKLMNRRAEELGMNDTHFLNPHGLHNVNHYTTARDLATLTAYCLQNPTFVDIVSCTDKNIQSYYWPNGIDYTTKYDLLRPESKLYYPGCIGVKTGYTGTAGRSFVGAARKSGITLVTVCLNPTKIDPNDKSYVEAFTDTIRLFDYGFSLYDKLTFSDLYAKCDDSLISVKVNNAATDDINHGYLKMSVADIPTSYNEYYLKSDINDTARMNAISEAFASRVEFVFDLPELRAPVTRGEVLGKVYFTTLEGTVLEGTLVASRDVAERVLTTEERVQEWINGMPKWLQALAPSVNPLAWIIYVIIIAVIGFFICRRVKKIRRRNRQRRREYERRKREYLKRKRREEYMRTHGGSKPRR